MNELFRWSEKKIAILALLFYSEVLDFGSLGMPPDPSQHALAVSNPLAPLSILLQYGIFGITLIFLALNWKRLVIPTLRDFFVWGLISLALLSFLWSDFPDISFRYGILTLGPTLFGLYLAARFSLKEQLQLLAWALSLGALISLLFTLGMPSAAIEAGANSGAWRGPFVQKNIMARAMVLAVIVNLAARKTFPPGYRRLLIWAGLAIALLLIVLSNSKSSLLILLVLLALRPLFSTFRWSGSRAIPLIILLILIGGSIGIWVVNNYEALVLGIGKDPSLSGRVDLWQVVIEKIWERPWLGYGYNAFWQEGGAAEDVWKAIRDKPPHSHNGFLNLSVELGLIGLACFVLSLLFFWIKSSNLVRLTKTSEGLFPILYITFLFLCNQTESTIISYRSVFWVLHVSLSLSIPLINLRKVAKPHQKENLESINQYEKSNVPPQGHIQS